MNYESNSIMAKELKNEIKYRFSFCEEQKEAKRLMLENEVVIITGNPGSGKSAIVAATCLDLIFKKLAHKITLTRPTVEVGKTIGLLPGEKDTKIAPYLEAFMESLHAVYPHPEKIEKVLSEHQITSDAIQFIRGKNISEGSILILEESQNTSKHEMEAVLTRLDHGKIFIIGDLRQKDIPGHSGLELAIELSTKIEGIKHIHLRENHRSGIVKDIIDYLYGVEG